jgi:hypothetical protein
MFHPLMDPITRLKDADLAEKIVDLSKKYFIAARSGNIGLIQQILLLLESYKEEQKRRQHQAAADLLKKQDKDLGDLINVD